MSTTESLVRKQAPCMDRCLASCVDGCLAFIPCYSLWKDGIREGQSFGKGIFGLRVVNFTTGRPITVMDSCLRNCCSLCPPLLLVTKGRRRVGDFIAGSIVIKDK
ncbi:MAG: RDD family protein [Candidatus Hodarchaeota archaeon]